MIKVRALILVPLFLVFACGDGSDVDLDTTISNKSQFTLLAVHIHDEALNYNSFPNILQADLLSGETIDALVPNRLLYVTVLRQPNQDSSALAYTTAYPWDPEQFRGLAYFDEQFRVTQYPSSTGVEAPSLRRRIKFR